MSGTQSIDLQFPDDRFIIRWALRFGGVLTKEPAVDNGKGPRTLCELKFDYHGIRAEAYDHPGLTGPAT